MFYAKVIYYDAIDDNERSFHALIPAGSMSEAVKIIADEWNDVGEVIIRQIQFGSSRIVYIPEECVEQVVEENTY